MIEAWLSSSETIASSGPVRVAKHASLAFQHEV